MPQLPIDKGAQHSAQDHHGIQNESIPQKGEQGAWTCSGECPADSEQASSKQIARNAESLRFEFNGLSVVGADAFPLDPLDKDKADAKGRAHHSVHVERVEAKHFLNTIPGNDFGFGHHDAKENAEKEEFDQLHDLKDHGKEEVGHEQAARKKSDCSDQGGQLQVGQATDGMSGSTAARPAGAKSDKKTAEDHNYQAFGGQKAAPAEKIFRQIGTIEGNAQFCQIFNRSWVELSGAGLLKK